VVELVAVLLSLGGAALNATASVAQRAENREETDPDESMLRMLLDLASRPLWWLGIAAMISGFACEAVALTVGQIALVEPVMIAELPLTIIGARLFLGRHLRWSAWASIVGLAVAVAVFVAALAPEGGDPASVPLAEWLVAVGITVAAAVGCVVVARRAGGARAAFLGIATGAVFALMSALVSGVGALYSHGGLGLVLTSWQTYAALVAGPSSFFLLQKALQAGTLVASQPGFTLVNPLVSVIWGVLVFGETTRTGPWLAVAGVAAAGVVAATISLVRATEHQQGGSGPDDTPDDTPRAADDDRPARTGAASADGRGDR
jgi:drug/metabolite transporter (DMT)-like permease